MCDNDMSIASNVICGLRLIGMVSGGYIGYRYGDRAKKYCCDKFPVIKRYHTDYVSSHFKKSQLSENTMFNMIGSFTGILGGFYAWPVAIPVMIYRTAEDYPQEIKKIKDAINGK